MVTPEILHEFALKHSDKTKFFAVSFFSSYYVSFILQAVVQVSSSA